MTRSACELLQRLIGARYGLTVAASAIKKMHCIKQTMPNGSICSTRSHHWAASRSGQSTLFDGASSTDMCVAATTAYNQDNTSATINHFVGLIVCSHVNTNIRLSVVASTKRHTVYESLDEVVPMHTERQTGDVGVTWRLCSVRPTLASLRASSKRGVQT